jgi:hypothetical protein
MPSPLLRPLWVLVIAVAAGLGAAIFLLSGSGDREVTASWPPSEDGTLFLRTDYEREDRWNALLHSIRTPSAEGFLASISIVRDPSFAGFTEEEIRRRAKEQNGSFLVLVADAMAQANDGFPVLVVDTSGEDRPSFRVAAKCLWAVENNLSLANMDWEEFAESVDADGIYRGC